MIGNGWSVVTDRRTLKALARKGYIVIPPEFGRRGRSSLGPVVHRYVFEGPALTEWYRPFEHRGRSFRLTYLDGCFKPFVTVYRGN